MKLERTIWRAVWWAGIVVLVCFILAVPPTAAAQQNSCLDCHSALEGRLQVSTATFSSDIHAEKGFTCSACHGGDPTAFDESAMSKAKGFRGKISRADIPAMCGKCHSDTAFIRKYNPSLRTDQEQQYRASAHGRHVAQGDVKAAVCIDCHSNHGIRPASDSRSPVNAAHVAETCGHCHSDSGYMAGRKIRTDQLASYQASVHYEALVKRQDPGAPNCATCHGNHGAAPPGVSSVEFVCSTCHVFQAQLFDSSKHKAAFTAANMPACVTCHGNHRILRPTDVLLGTGPQSVCVTCHSQGDPGYKAAGALQEKLVSLDHKIVTAEQSLSVAEFAGMEVSQAKLELAQAHDALTKARVTVHTVDVSRVEQDVAAGRTVADKGRVAGERAMEERSHRQRGLLFSLGAIALVIIGLKLFITEYEKKNGQS